jgi:outer membrane receptor protein involved in Fe transport
MTLKTTVTTVLTILFFTAAYGQSGPNPEGEPADTKGQIIGKIIEASSEDPMEYTSIAVFRMIDSTLVTGTITDPDGEFQLTDVPYGRYYVEVKYIGYEKMVYSPVVVSRESKNVNLGNLTLSVNAEALEEVEVIADQRRVQYKLDKKVVNVGEDLNAAGGTAVDVLENTPSVSVDIEGNVSLRGSGNFTVLINGKPTVLDAADALRQIPASSIRNIEIITNPSVKYDPDGNGGIINVVLKEQIEKGTTGLINASIGLNDKYRIDALVNRRVGKLNYFIGGGWNDNRYLGTLTRENVTYLEGGVEKRKDANGSFDFLRGGTQIRGGVDYDLNRKNNIALEANAGQYSFGIDRSNNSHEYTIPALTDTYYSNTDLMLTDRLYYSINMNYTKTFDTTDHKLVAMADFSHRSGDGIEELEFFETDADFKPLSSVLPERMRNIETGASYDYRFQIDYTKPFNNGKLEAGYQVRLDDNLDEFVFQEFDPDTDVWTSIGENRSSIDFFRNIQGAYLQYGGQINQLQIQAGIRGEYTYRLIEYENFNTSYEINRFDFYPTLHLARQFENDHQVMISYSKRVNRPRGHYLDSIPSYIDKQTVRIGNPGLEPEYVNSFELGYQKGWDKNFLAFEAYYRNTNNLITRVTEYDNETEIFYQRFENINEDHVIGSELMANWKFARWFNLNASTNVYYYRIMGELLGQEVDNSNFSWNANANATFTVTPLSRIQANMGYHGPSVTAQGSSEGMYYLNLAVRQDLFKRKLSATLQVRDLFGTMKREFTASGEDFSQYVLMQREPRVVMLTLSYKINNYRSDPREERQQGSGGMEMDSGF